jgi:hypothetical protein
MCIPDFRMLLQRKLVEVRSFRYGANGGPVRQRAACLRPLSCCSYGKNRVDPNCFPVYWRARLERGGLAESLAITGQLHTGLRERAPAWPTEQDREEDLETHRRVAAALARTAPVAASGEAPVPRGRARRVR